MRDALAQYLFAGHAVRAALVDVHAGLDDMLVHADYTPGVRRLVGEALAAAPLLASHLKFQGRISLQYQGEGALSLLVVQIDDRLHMRGMAKARAGADGDFTTLVQGGRLSVLLEPGTGSTRYEGIVPLTGGSLAAALEAYYAQSEQLPTRLCLAAAGDQLRGLMLQRMPVSADEYGADEDAYWEHLGALFSTLAPDELLTVAPGEIMHRLFHAERITAHASRALSLACHCSRASVSRLLLALGECDLEQLLVERGKVEVSCEFCGRKHDYSALDVRSLLAAQHADDAGATHH